MKRKVLLHFHIFKNAGTTIDSVLEKNFLENAIRGDGEKPSDILPMEIVIDYLDKNKNIKVFSSHQIRFPIPKNNEIEFFPLVFIRHPLDRAFSVFSYKNRVDPLFEVAFTAKTMALSSYLEWNLHPPKGKTKNMTMRNFQVLYLSRDNVKSKVNSNDLNIAIERLKSCLVIGVVDRLDESLVVAEEVLRKDFPEIDLSYIKQNISKDRKNNLQERLDDAKSQVGEILWEDLIKHNELDLKLYEVANKELDDRIKKINNFEKKLNEFKNRKNMLLKRLLEYTSPFKNKRILYSFENKNWHIVDKKKRAKEAKERNIQTRKKKTSRIIVWAITSALTTLRIIKPKTNYQKIRKKYERNGS